MLTDLEESGKKKADKYWPDEGSPTMALGNGVTIEHLTTSYQGTYYERKLRINQSGVNPRELTQIQTKRWADLTAPDETNILRDMVNRVREVCDNRNNPILVHCSAGVGRTGTFIALYKLTQDYMDKK